MGVGSGYGQGDVTALAHVITGWAIAGRDGKLGELGTFVFNASAHEPDPARLLGGVNVQDGVAQGESALADLAREGATADHIARKFARHFVADSPDPALVRRLAAVFRRTNGDLGALARALVADEEAWSAPATKIRNPRQLTIAAYRAFARSPSDPGPVLNALNLLGMPLWQPGGPNGFSDDSSDLASPEGMKKRLELAAQFARQIKDAPPPLALVEDILGPRASAATREAVTRAESREQAYALLILSPKFQRRWPVAGFRLASLASRSSRRGWRFLRFGDDPALGERGGRARSAPRRRHPARRARRPLLGRAARRPRLRRSARPPRAAVARRPPGAEGWRLLRPQPFDHEFRTALRLGRRWSCTPPRQITANDRTSTPRMCSRAACRPPAASSAAGTIAPSSRYPRANAPPRPAPSRSAPLRRSSCAGPRQSSAGRPPGWRCPPTISSSA